jgi:hypothetical protein
VVAGFGLAACGGGGGGGGQTQITITISPTAANVPIGLTVQFIGNVSGSSNTNVTYQVNGVTGGDQVHGTINSSGLYLAPSTVPNPATVTVTAIAQANTSITATAMVTIIAATAVSVNPAAASLLAGQQQQFNAVVNGMPSTNVTWQVNGMLNGSPVLGTIDTTGLYTAPITPPPGGSVTVTAVSKGPAVGSGNATVTILFSNAALHGQYAFTFSGTGTTGILTAAGSITADGNGNITTGIEDVNSNAVINTGLSITGVYSINPDGRGTMTLILPAGLNNQTFRFVLLNNQHGFVIRFDTFATGTGSIDLQDSSAFSNAALAANFVFGFFGIDGANAPLGLAGNFATATAGNNGVADINDNGAVGSPGFPIGFSLTVAATGRGTATLTGLTSTLTFVFYVIDKNTLNFVEVDSGAFPVLSGQALAEAGGPFSPASLSGNFAFTVSGAGTAGPLATGGVFTSNGTGGFSAGTLDVNNNGTVTSGTALLPASNYTLAANGRGTMALSVHGATFNFAIYPAANGTVEMLEIDASFVTSGTALAQTTGSLAGSFGFNLDGTTLGANGVEFDANAQTNMDGSGNLSGGVLDLNAGGVLSNGVQWGGMIPIGANGRGTGTLTTNITTFSSVKVAAYQVDGSTVLIFSIDSGDLSAGVLARQF